MNRIEEEKSRQPANEWQILNDVYTMLLDGKVLNTSNEEPIVRFKHPEELRELFDFSITSDGVNNVDRIKEICKQIIYYSVKTGHPQFHNQLFGGVDPYGLAGSWITEALNTSQYTYEVAPVFTLMENEVIQMFSKKFGYDAGDGIFCPGGSISNMYGMVLARHKAIPNVKTTGIFGLKPLVAFMSAEAHYSTKKAAHWLGIGTDNLIVVQTDSRGRMLATDLDRCIQQTLNENKQPFYVNATAGTTVLGAFDDLNAIADVCEKYNLWLHVDGCLGGSLIMSSKYKHLIAGIERTDSLSWNPHKSLGVPLQCSMLLIRRKGLLHECNSAAAQYLFQQDKFYDVSYDTGDKSVQCGRKVDVLKFWLMLKARGLNEFERLMDNSMDLSKYLAEQLKIRDGFRLIIDEPFQYTNVCFWFIPKRLRGLAETNEWWEQLYKVSPLIKEKMIMSGTLMVGYSPLPSKGKGNFLRMVLSCFPPAKEADIHFILDEINRIGETV